MIRRMQLSDVDAVWQIEKQVQSHPWTRSQFEDAVESYQSTVIEYNQKVVGFCLMQPVLDEANLLLMAVDPTMQGRGLGSQILADSIERLGDKCVQIFLEVRESNQAAIALYEKLDFHQIDIRKNYYPKAQGGKENAIIMVRSSGENIFDFKM